MFVITKNVKIFLRRNFHPKFFFTKPIEVKIHAFWRKVGWSSEYDGLVKMAPKLTLSKYISDLESFVKLLFTLWANGCSNSTIPIVRIATKIFCHVFAKLANTFISIFSIIIVNFYKEHRLKWNVQRNWNNIHATFDVHKYSLYQLISWNYSLTMSPEKYCMKIFFKLLWAIATGSKYLNKYNVNESGKNPPIIY